jgi:transcriptional regulator with XRE-family HTH domain
MKGEIIKSLLIEKGYNIAQVAEMIGTSQQNLASNLKHTDVRSGLLEKIADAIGLPISVLYGESSGVAQRIAGNNNTQISGDSNTVAPSDAALLELLKANSDQLTMAMKQTSKAQEQMDRVLDRLEGRSLEMPDNF